MVTELDDDDDDDDDCDDDSRYYGWSAGVVSGHQSADGGGAR